MNAKAMKRKSAWAKKIEREKHRLKNELREKLTYEAGTSLDLPRHGATRALPQVVNGVSCWVRWKRKRSGSVQPATYLRRGSGHPRLSEGGKGEKVRQQSSIVGACPGSLVTVIKLRDRNNFPVLV